MGCAEDTDIELSAAHHLLTEKKPASESWKSRQGRWSQLTQIPWGPLGPWMPLKPRSPGGPYWEKEILGENIPGRSTIHPLGIISFSYNLPLLKSRTISNHILKDPEVGRCPTSKLQQPLLLFSSLSLPSELCPCPQTEIEAVPKMGGSKQTEPISSICILNTFHRGTMKNVLTNGTTVWFGW